MTGHAHDPAALGELVLSRCRDAGFAHAGIAPVEPSPHADHVRSWLRAGRHGAMTYLARTLDDRLDARRLLPSARAVVMVAAQYADGTPDPPPPSGASPRGRVARYARGQDYHDVIKARLTRLTHQLAREHPHAEFRKFVDSSPVMEREHAARAGLGWVGKHTLIIHPVFGSYFVLGGFLTTLDIAPAHTAPEHGLTADRCGTCTRCIDACPTQAIAPYTVDASRCIAYLTIEERRPLSPELSTKTAPWVFGCDVCQEVCPYNAPTAAAGVTKPRPLDADIGPTSVPGGGFNLLALLDWTPADRATATRGTPMKRARLDMLKRSARAALDAQRLTATSPPPAPAQGPTPPGAEGPAPR
jgi:epoxyqueuosine reductase